MFSFPTDELINRDKNMEKLIELSVKFVVCEAIQRARSRFELPGVVDRMLDKLFQMNTIERNVNKNSSVLKEIREEIERDAILERDKLIDEWSRKAIESSTDKVRENEAVIKNVAKLVFSLGESGVDEVVIQDSENVSVTIGQAAFTEKTLTSIVEMATSNSVVQSFDAKGREGHCEVLEEEFALPRILFIVDLVNVLSSKWDGPSRTDPKPQQLSQLHKKSSVSWILPEMKQKIVSTLGKDTFKQLAKRINGTLSQDNKILNVFIVGSEKTGKSTTQFLLSRKGRDGIPHLGKPTRSITAEEVSFENHHIRFWDTPGLNFASGLDRVPARRLRDKMQAVNGISAIILQTNIDGYKSEQEKSIISMLNRWFQLPRVALRENLIIAFKAGPESTNREIHLKNWQSFLTSIGVGEITPSNYVHFDALNLSYDNYKKVCQLNRSVVKGVNDIIKNMVISIDEVNWRASEEVLNCLDAQDSELRNDLKGLYGQEFSSDIKSDLERARKLHATRKKEDLVITVKSNCKLLSPFFLVKRLCFKNFGQEFALRATGPLSEKMVEQILPESEKKGKAKRRNDNKLSRQIAILEKKSRRKYKWIEKVCQRLDQWRLVEYTDEWIATVCNNSFEYYLHDTAPSARGRVYLVFDRDTYVTEQAVDITLRHLGNNVTIELLNLSLGSDEGADENVEDKLVQLARKNLN